MNPLPLMLPTGMEYMPVLGLLMIMISNCFYFLKVEYIQRIGIVGESNPGIYVYLGRYIYRVISNEDLTLITVVFFSIRQIFLKFVNSICK